MDLRLQAGHDLSDKKRDIITEYRRIYDASIVLAVVIVMYIVSWILLGSLFLMAALMEDPMEPQLAARGYSFYQIALFRSISAFTNSGVSISSNSLVYMGNNSSALFVVSCLIFAGNVFFPMFLRWSIRGLYKVCIRFPEYKKIAASLKYILDNPRRLTTQLFNHDSTVYLVQVAIMSNLIIYFFFLTSCTYRSSMQKYGSVGNICALGLFQIINLRHAGFGVFDFRDLPQEMLFVIAIAMVRQLWKRLHVFVVLKRVLLRLESA